MFYGEIPLGCEILPIKRWTSLGWEKFQEWWPYPGLELMCDVLTVGRESRGEGLTIARGGSAEPRNWTSHYVEYDDCWCWICQEWKTISETFVRHLISSFLYITNISLEKKYISHKFFFWGGHLGAKWFDWGGNAPRAPRSSVPASCA